MADKVWYTNQELLRRLGQKIIEWSSVNEVQSSAQPSRSVPYPTKIQEGRFESSTLPVTNNYNRELYRVRASRLVDFFPDELVIQEKTVSIIRRTLMASFIETLPVKDIGRVILIDVPIFDGIRILGKNVAHDLQIKGLPKDKARFAKEIIEGLLLEEKGSVEIPQWLSTEERSDMLATAGHHPEHSEERRLRP
jgi:hypothetical protein